MEGKSILPNSQRNFQHKDIKMHVVNSREQSCSNSEVGLGSQITVEVPVYNVYTVVERMFNWIIINS